MKHLFRTLALAGALALTPACAQLHLEAFNPIASRQSDDQRAYAIVESYAALLETAANIIRDPDVAVEVKRSIGRAEAAATPSVQVLEVAFSAYLRARAGYEAASRADDSTFTRALNTLNAASQALEQAIDRVQAPMAELQALITARGGDGR